MTEQKEKELIRDIQDKQTILNKYRKLKSDKENIENFSESLKLEKYEIKRISNHFETLYIPNCINSMELNDLIVKYCEQKVREIKTEIRNL